MKRIKKLVCMIGACAVLITAVAADSSQTGILSIQVQPGVNWKMKRPPQMAVWVETADGTYIETLFVTKRAGNKSWIGRPKGGRPESLPVWYHASQQTASTETQGQADNTIDAVTSATPGKKIAIPEIELPAGTVYVIRVEVNHSFDYNDTWPKKAKKDSSGYSGVNGQPSVIYSGILDTTSKKTTAKTLLTPAGTGSIDGSDGLIHNDLARLTTASAILDRVEAKWEIK